MTLAARETAKLRGRAEIAGEVYVRHRDRCQGCGRPCNCFRCPGSPAKLCERGKILQTIANERAAEFMLGADG